MSEPMARPESASPSRIFNAYLYGGLALAVAFLFVPLVALVLKTSPAAVTGQFSSPAARTALLISFETSLIALGLTIAFGTPAAYMLARQRVRGGRALTTLFELPLVLPPAVAGIALLAAFGQAGLLGGELRALGVELPATRAAVIVAVAFVASPLYVSHARSAFAIAGESGEAALPTVGRLRDFVRVEVPRAVDGIAAGAALAWARALGEYGATAAFAGDVTGKTRTVTLAIYGTKDRDIGTAIALATMLLVFSVTLLVVARLIQRRASAKREAREPLSARPARGAAGRVALGAGVQPVFERRSG
jgi:molybdate transport system permease protein